MYYPRFTKAIIHHFITKDKSISMRNRMFMHTAQDDSILGTMRFISKSKDFQVYGALLPRRMTNRQMRESTAYKTYLAYATSEASPKMKRKFKKPSFPSKKRTLSPGVRIQDTPSVFVSKKKAPAKAERSKGIELLSDAALLEEAQLKKALKRSKRDTNIHQTGGSSERADFESEVPDEPKVKSSDTSEGTGLKPGVPDVSKADSSESETDSENQETNEDEEETEDEFVHTPPNYVPTDDETNDESNDVTKEEYESINEELYGDVNVRLTDVEPDDEDKGDKEMTNAKIEDAEHENVIHESPELKDVDNSTKVISTIQFEVPKTIKEYLGSSLDDAMHKSILEDEDTMDEGVADKLKKRKPNDANKDEGPSAGSDRGLKQQKTSKDTEQSKKANSTETSKGTSKSQPKSTGKSTQVEEIVFEAGDTQGLQNIREDTGNTDEPPVVNVDPKDWFKKPERPLTPDPKWNKGKSAENKPTQKWLSDLAKAEKPSRIFDDLMSTLIDFSACVMNRLKISELTHDILVGLAYNILKGTCRSYVELDYKMEEYYKALMDQLD
ncbi:hypothetical protein Tco_0708264 [Tanacetum coccineum]